MYYVWRNSIMNGTKDIITAGLTVDNPWFDFVSDYFLYNEPVPKEIPPLPIDYVTDDNPKLPVLDYIVAMSKSKLISEKLYNIFKSYAVPYMEFFSSTLLIEKSGKVHTNLYSFNIYREFDFANLEKSEHPADDRYVHHYTKLVLNETNIPSNLKFFRLAHTLDFIVHEDIRNECIDQGITGVRFISVEEWNYRNRYK